MAKLKDVGITNDCTILVATRVRGGVLLDLVI